MAIVERSSLTGCDGFRAETPRGPLGWVEETWLGPGDTPAAVALRLLDGRRGLLLAGDVVAVDSDCRELVLREGASVLELDAPRLEQLGERIVAAHCETTGEQLDLPPPPKQHGDRSVGAALAILFPLLAVLIATEIVLAFLVAYLVTRRA